MNDQSKTTAIVGLGALGMLYASQITASLGPDNLFFLGDRERIERYQQMPFTINGKPFSFRIEDCTNARPVDFMIVAVKYGALSSALDTMETSVGSDTTILSVMNGIDSEEIIAKRFGREKVLYCIAQGMDAMRFGSSLTYTRPGTLCLGTRTKGQESRLMDLTRYFDRAGVSYTVEADIVKRLWGKFMLNVGINQTCMAFETNYGGVLTPGEAHDSLIGAMKEVIELSIKEGVHLSEKDMDFYINLIKTLSPESVPSMRQDGLARRYSEVEMFSGVVRRLAAKHGLTVPVNDMLYDKIKGIEAAYPSLPHDE
ncbi:ketopantoate reductase family protein [Lacrimispora celerecrescens]|uniref:ketopantoate reductase family protein n=1 Tax=Lacrimispora celerecrescens TaxID=29354 RepID=UPI0016480290|nr:ketopantoate reductase family protein [Lacrimispora celerecrescens]